MDQELRIHALCNRLGHLWSKTKKAVVDDVVTERSLKEGECTIFGRLYGNPDVNFQAFQTTMKKAWKTEKVTITHLELGIFSFVFESVKEKCRILDGGPWSFSRYLLVLKEWEPSFAPQCYSFSSCAFWLHINGLPVEGRKKEVIFSLAEQVGRVVEVKIEAKGYAGITACKAKVILNLLNPLKPGMIYSYKGKELWLDFRYERLPIFCFSCGKIGHHVQICAEIPYEEGRFAENDTIYYGPWLKSEMNSPSPYWKSFYETTLGDGMEETSNQSPHSNSTSGMERASKHSEISKEDKGKRKMREDEGLKNAWEIFSHSVELTEATPLRLELPSFQGGSSLKKNQKKVVNRETK